MKTPPFEQDVNAQYGAPMGRPSNHHPGHIDTDEPIIIELRRVPLDAGGYDPGGAYWGANNDRKIGDLYWWSTEDGDVSDYTRAKDYADLTNQIVQDYPRAAFRKGGECVIDPYDLDEFTTAYIECAMWSTTCNEEEEDGDSGGPPLDDRYSIDEIAQECLKKMVEDCRDFRDGEAWQAVLKHSEFKGNSQGGYDFWLNRNGHGAGFWDGDWPEPHGDALSDWSKTFGGVDLYVGDDHKIHTS
jgi:hypothetical protein